MLVLALLLVPAPLPAGTAFVEIAAFPAPEAHQAVAVDADHFYAIGNRVVAKYDKRTGERVAAVRASPELPLIHMNGGAINEEGWLVVSHSNFPRLPMTGSAEVFTVSPLEHVATHSLGPTDGSLTWLSGDSHQRYEIFAHYELPRAPGYDTGVERTAVVRQTLGLTGGRGAWVLPPALVARLRPHSVSGASFAPDGTLYLSGHDRPEVYRVRFPRAGSEMVLEAVHPAPIAGQGIAWDPAEPGVLWGTRRREGLVVKMRLTE